MCGEEREVLRGRTLSRLESDQVSLSLILFVQTAFHIFGTQTREIFRVVFFLFLCCENNVGDIMGSTNVFWRLRRWIIVEGKMLFPL